MTVKAQLEAEGAELEKLAGGVHGEIATTIAGYLFMHVRHNKNRASVRWSYNL